MLFWPAFGLIDGAGVANVNLVSEDYVQLNSILPRLPSTKRRCVVCGLVATELDAAEASLNILARFVPKEMRPRRMLLPKGDLT